ncbi:MAG: hypothetical protein IT379_42120 [Deltaproteobacteria bacterium]|nr:hypothetical protein [Deltaproteobacteria bacterium]
MPGASAASTPPRCAVRISVSPTVATSPAHYPKLLSTLGGFLSSLRDATRALVTSDPGQVRVEFRQEVVLRDRMQPHPSAEVKDRGWDPVASSQRSYLLRHVNANTIDVVELDAILRAETEFLTEQLAHLAQLRLDQPDVHVLVEIDYSGLTVIDGGDYTGDAVPCEAA